MNVRPGRDTNSNTALDFEGIFVVLTFRGVVLTFRRLKEFAVALNFSNFQGVLSRAGCCWSGSRHDPVPARYCSLLRNNPIEF